MNESDPNAVPVQAGGGDPDIRLGGRHQPGVI
jgi:hypothetical protein